MSKPIFVLIFGPPAVGKLSVARALVKRTGFGLTHNHVAIEAALHLFEFGSQEHRDLVSKIRKEIFLAAARSHLPGMIGTFVWNFASSTSQELVEGWCDIFREHGWHIVFVELKAVLETRLERNRSPDRAVGKASKLDPIVSEHILMTNEREWTMISPEDFVMVPPADQFISLCTDSISPSEVAKWIIAQADLPEKR